MKDVEKLWVLAHNDRPIGLFKSAHAAFIWLSKHKYAFLENELPAADDWDRWGFTQIDWPDEFVNEGVDYSSWWLRCVPVGAGIIRDRMIIDD